MVLRYIEANQTNQRWAFTSGNASTSYFDDFNDLRHLNLIDWDAVRAKYWQSVRDAKQAGFLLEKHLPWELIQGIGVYDRSTLQQVSQIINNLSHKPQIRVWPEAYY